jgi:hypothetical protein
MRLRDTNNEVTLSVLEQIAQEAGVVLYEVRDETNSRSTVFKFTLKPDAATEIKDEYDGELKKWQRQSHMGRKVHAVCWHGYFVFMAKLFARYPWVKLDTAAAKYDGLMGFWDTFQSTRDRNVGSMMVPMPYDCACFCGGQEWLDEYRDEFYTLKAYVEAYGRKLG